MEDPVTTRTSAVLAGLLEGDPQSRLTLGDLTQILGDRAFGLLMVIFALPNGIPGPAMPGFSTIVGFPLLLIALQMTVGRRQVWLPGFIRRWSFRRGTFKYLMDKGLPVLRWLERLFHPRFEIFVSGFAERLLGLFLTFLTLVMMMPIPFANIPPAWAIMVISLGLLEKDGIAVLAGLAVGAIGTCWSVLICYAGWLSIDHLR